ncbi:hypothetical protein [Mesomycoplasma molare]|uniref:Uncharacterized protein n=1 Tax=Mesomycoplasma molare TaxID=171288 RepID=A0ABY5TU82_9BACT|nr:hypothetical protein [Mesomycoplasma molare]UWD34220.1 hypothetical protein NX772_00070 [Mesomycoplasma molare]
MKNENRKITLQEYANNIDKYTKPLDELLKENGDWDEVVRIMNILAKL